MARLGHPVFDVIVDHVNPAVGETIVDLGCGYGPALHALRVRQRSLQLIGLDVKPEAVAALQATLPDVRAEVADLNEPLALGNWAAGS